MSLEDFPISMRSLSGAYLQASRSGRLHRQIESIGKEFGNNSYEDHISKLGNYLSGLTNADQVLGDSIGLLTRNYTIRRNVIRNQTSISDIRKISHFPTKIIRNSLPGPLRDVVDQANQLPEEQLYEASLQLSGEELGQILSN